MICQCYACHSQDGRSFLQYYLGFLDYNNILQMTFVFIYVCTYMYMSIDCLRLVCDDTTL
jgi:hypothetical protein